MNGKKTYIIAILMLISAALSAILSFLQGEVTLAQAVSSIDFHSVLEAAGIAALRHGIAKS